MNDLKDLKNPNGGSIAIMKRQFNPDELSKMDDESLVFYANLFLH